MNDEVLRKIAFKEITQYIPEYKMPDVPMPLDSGDNRPLGFSYFVNMDVLPGVVAVATKFNPSLDESCYNPRTGTILDLIPDSDSDIDKLLNSLFIEKKVSSRYVSYVTRVVNELFDDEISDNDKQRIKEVFATTLQNMKTVYCPVVDQTFVFI